MCALFCVSTDRTTGGRLQEELEEARAKLTDYCDSVNVELQDRRHLLHTLETGLAYHQSRLMQAKAIQEVSLLIPETYRCRSRGGFAWGGGRIAHLVQPHKGASALNLSV